MSQKKTNNDHSLYGEPMDIEKAQRILNIMETSMFEAALDLTKKDPMWDVLKQRISAVSFARGILCKQQSVSPHPTCDMTILACSHCGSGEYLQNEDGNKNSFCGQCGAAIQWETAEAPLTSKRDESCEDCALRRENERLKAEHTAIEADFKQLADDTGEGCGYCKNLPCSPEYDHCIGFVWKAHEVPQEIVENRADSGEGS